MVTEALESSPQEFEDLPSPYKLTGRITGPQKRSVTRGTSTRIRKVWFGRQLRFQSQFSGLVR